MLIGQFKFPARQPNAKRDPSRARPHFLVLQARLLATMTEIEAPEEEAVLDVCLLTGTKEAINWSFYMNATPKCGMLPTVVTGTTKLPYLIPKGQNKLEKSLRTRRQATSLWATSKKGKGGYQGVTQQILKITVVSK